MRNPKSNKKQDIYKVSKYFTKQNFLITKWKRIALERGSLADTTLTKVDVSGRTTNYAPPGKIQ